MNPKKKWPSPQAYVDRIVYDCLAHGIRQRDKIIREIQTGRVMERNLCAPTELTGLENLDIGQKSLIVAVSRTTSRKDSHGHRDIWCVPGAHRYVSITRLKELVESSDAGSITAEEIVELGGLRDDLHAVALHLEAKGRTMLSDAYKVRERAINAHSAVLDLS